MKANENINGNWTLQKHCHQFINEGLSCCCIFTVSGFNNQTLCQLERNLLIIVCSQATPYLHK